MTQLDVQDWVWNWWAQRLLVGFLVGNALGFTGSLLQRFFSNRLADPHLLGMSSSALLGSVFASSSGALAALSFVPFVGAYLGGLAGFIVILSLRNRNVLFAGLSLNAFCGAAIMLLMLWDHPLYPQVDIGKIVGRIESPGWVATSALGLGITAGIFGLNHIRSSIELVAYGHPLERLQVNGSTSSRLTFFFLICFLVSSCTAFAGAVGFIGLMVPHFSRFLQKVFPLPRGFAFELKLSALLGGFLLVVADFSAQRLLYPVTMPVGIPLALLGSAFLFLLIFFQQREEPV